MLPKPSAFAKSQSLIPSRRKKDECQPEDSSCEFRATRWRASQMTLERDSIKGFEFGFFSKSSG
jgi:hypothetical protein